MLFLCAVIINLGVSAVFLFPPSVLWTAGIIAGSFLAGGCIAAWGFFLKSSAPKNERFKMIADMLILSNLLMIVLNTAAVHLSLRAGLALSMAALLGAFLLTLRLPSAQSGDSPPPPEMRDNPVKIAGLLAFLCLFIVLITIDSGLMYQVMGPAYSHLSGLTSWYWALPYVAAIFVMRILPQKINWTYILYTALAMIGLAFIGFITLGRSAGSYLVVNTLMMGACGVYDLFWWSILGQMLEYHKNPAAILGIGLSANILGVLLGGLAGRAVISPDIDSAAPSLLALAVVCVTLALLPLLNRHLSLSLQNSGHLWPSDAVTPAQAGTSAQTGTSMRFHNLSERENQVASLLLQGKTYRAIAGELFISENTVKYYVKNIYSKLSIQSRAELIDFASNNTDAVG